MKRNLVLFLLSTAAMAQTVQIPAIPMTVPIVINGTTVKITFTIPAQTITVPSSGGLPSGMTFSSTAGLTVTGPITATQINLTGGPTLPTCASGLFLFKLTSGMLQPTCYVAPTLSIPPITVSQAASPENTLTFTP